MFLSLNWVPADRDPRIWETCFYQVFVFVTALWMYAYCEKYCLCWTRKVWRYQFLSQCTL